MYLFGTLELRRTTYNTTSGEYLQNATTETPFLNVGGQGLGRVVYQASAFGEPRIAASSLHVLLNIGDHLGSASIVIDKATGELAERRTYLAYGATESDYRPARWKGFREDYGFTGKEEDIEIGLQYFGKRYLSPYLGRWVSADPLAVHSPGEADLNLYAYVKGRTLLATDPLGLECGVDKSCAATGGTEATTDYDAEPKVSFTFEIRRFAPFETFGGRFHGDAESRGIPANQEGKGGFTTDPQATSRVRTTVDVDGETVTASSQSSVSSHPILGTATATPSTTWSAGPISKLDGRFDVNSAGSNPLVPLSPSIDTRLRLDYSQQSGQLRLAGEAWGDNFPNLEVYATDRSGNSTLLGTFQTSHGAAGPMFLYGAGENDQVMSFDATISVDSQGEFTSSPNVTSSTPREEE